MGENAPSKITVRKWVKITPEGRTQCKDESRYGRPVTCCDEEANYKVRRIVDDDRRVTIPEIAEQLDISVGKIFTILKVHLCKKKLFGRWIPHFLTRQNE